MNTRKRWHTWSFLLAGMLGVSVFFFLWHIPDSRHLGGEPEKSFSNDTAGAETERRKLEEQGASSGSEFLPLERGRVPKRYAELLAKFRELSIREKKKRAEYAELKPLIEQATHATNLQLFKVNERYEYLWKKYEKIFADFPPAVEKMQAARREMVAPFAVLEALRSSLPVGESTLGDVTRDLIENTDYSEYIKKHLLMLAGKYPDLAPDAASRLGLASSVEEITSEFMVLAPEFKNSFDQRFNGTVSDPELEAYWAERFTAEMAAELAEHYRKSWITEIDRASDERSRVGKEMNAFRDALPKDSPERTAIAEATAELYAELYRMRDPDSARK